MCDAIPGELIICFPKIDNAGGLLIEDIMANNIDDVSYVESLEGKLSNLNLKPNDGLEFELHRVFVPPGKEQWKITYLHFYYKRRLIESFIDSASRNELEKWYDLHTRTWYQFTVAPNHWLSLASNIISSTVKSANFQFSPDHTRYRNMIGIQSSPANIDQVKIIVIDSGIADDITFQLADMHNFVEDQNPKVVTDEIGHGTAVALIINDLVPGAQITIYKVAYRDGRISEWDFLAAITNKNCADAHVVNMSVYFGLEASNDKACGRESHSSRSAVYENMIDQYSKRPIEPVFVAAAGNFEQNSNRPQSELTFPARFANVLAIGSINSQYDLSSFSNYGNQDHVGDPHENHYVMPGGESDPSRIEYVGKFGSSGEQMWGTSFATPYASSLVAYIIARDWGTQNVQRTNLMQSLKNTADTSGFGANYSETLFGNGMLRV